MGRGQQSLPTAARPVQVAPVALQHQKDCLCTECLSSVVLLWVWLFLVGLMAVFSIVPIVCQATLRHKGPKPSLALARAKEKGMAKPFNPRLQMSPSRPKTKAKLQKLKAKLGWKLQGMASQEKRCPNEP